jgi:hypothetical protein
MGIFDLFKKKKLEEKPISFFENLSVENFIGLVINESTTAQIKDELSSKGLSYKEYPVFGHDDECDLTLNYVTSDINWSCRLNTKNNVLQMVVLNIYSPDSYSIYQTLCKEFQQRFSSSYNISQTHDSYEGTIKTCFENKSDPWQFTEVEYDSSPILGQKNVYIRYFKID